jgi:hypothetical protein
MTGVGGRPEVILEGSNHIDGPWLEYNFLYKPGNVNTSLPFVGTFLVYIGMKICITLDVPSNVAYCILRTSSCT